MPKGVTVHSVVNAKYDKKAVTRLLKASQYAEHTKACIRMVLIEGKSMQEAGSKHGVSRQLVYKRCLEVLNRIGAETLVPAA